ncbi:hypothetical protein BYT27DRAFT_7306637 [Phlegmacium glaucopus]|nr:hypothetical protein BYT27DRAFT_7306637 [Phlegmacium glaucopus]
MDIWESKIREQKRRGNKFETYEFGKLIIRGRENPSSQWDGRVMAITVEDFDLEVSFSGGQEGHEFGSKLPYDVRKRLHITVGTKSEKVPAVEAKAMVQEWRKNRNTDNNIKSIKSDDLIVYGRIKVRSFALSISNYYKPRVHHSRITSVFNGNLKIRSSCANSEELKTPGTFYQFAISTISVQPLYL